jgi:hypothetical protein
MSKHLHRRNNSSFPEAPATEDVGGQIDRLNSALHMMMQEIEHGVHSSRVSSRVSVLNSEVRLEDENFSFESDNPHLPPDFEERIEELLLTLDRNQMIIEDYRSNELKRDYLKITDSYKSTHYDIFQIRSEIENKLKTQKQAIFEIDKNKYEEKLEELNFIKEDYLKKRKEIISGFEKLNIKEQLLEQKEKDLRASRMAFDRHRFLWDQSHKDNELKASNHNPLPSNQTFIPSNLNPIASGQNPLRSSAPLGMNMKDYIKNATNVLSEKAINPDNQFNSIEEYQNQLKTLEQEFANVSHILDYDTSRLEIQIDKLKNKIAALRGEKVIFESNQSTKIVNNLMASIQKQVGKENLSTKRSQLLEIIKKQDPTLSSAKPDDTNSVFSVKTLEQKLPETSQTVKRFLFSDAPTPIGINTPKRILTPKKILTPRSETNNHYKLYLENKKKALIEKEKELNQREILLQQTWMKLPGAKELIDNVNMTVNRINLEKRALESQREDLEKEKLEVFKAKQILIANIKR